MKRLFPEFRVHLEKVPPGEKAIQVPYPDNLGKRTKLGGEPDWIQDDETPVCPLCGQEMSLVAQIDSIDYTDYRSNGPYLFGDVGMLYVFYCLDCGRNPQVIQQDY